MDFWLNNPSTKKNSVSLTIAVTGFIFTMIFATASLVAAWITGEPEYLSYLAGIATSILAPSLGAFSVNKYTSAKFSNAEKTPQKVLTEDEEQV